MLSSILTIMSTLGKPISSRSSNSSILNETSLELPDVKTNKSISEKALHVPRATEPKSHISDKNLLYLFSQLYSK